MLQDVSAWGAGRAAACVSAVVAVAAGLLALVVPAAQAAQTSYFSPRGLYSCTGGLGYQFKTHSQYAVGKLANGKMTGHVVSGRYERIRNRITGRSGYLYRYGEWLLIQQSDLAVVNHRGHVTTKCKTDRSANADGPLASMGPEPAPSLFGIDTSTYDSSHANFVNDFPTAGGLGSRWDRFTLLAKTGTGDFSTDDYEVQQARLRGMGVILSFDGIASACSKTTPNISGCPPTTSSDLSAYRTYVMNVLSRYHNVVDYYESWIEPNHGSQWDGMARPAQYAALLKAEYQVFQQFNSHNPNSGPGGSKMKLLFASTNGFTIAQPDGRTPNSSGDMAILPFIHAVLGDLHRAKAFDAVALHPYRYPSSNGPNDLEQDYVGTLSYPAEGCAAPTSYGACFFTWTQELEAYEQEFTDHGYGQPPMWLTEFGWPGTTNPICYLLPGYCPNDSTQAADLKAAYADLLRLPFVRGALWFNLRDYQPAMLTPDPAFFYYFGLLCYDYALKPAADDFEALAAANANR